MFVLSCLSASFTPFIKKQPARLSWYDITHNILELPLRYIYHKPMNKCIWSHYIKISLFDDKLYTVGQMSSINVEMWPHNYQWFLMVRIKQLTLSMVLMVHTGEQLGSILKKNSELMGFAKKRSIARAAHSQNCDALCYHLYFYSPTTCRLPWHTLNHTEFRRVQMFQMGRSLV